MKSKSYLRASIMASMALTAICALIAVDTYATSVAAQTNQDAYVVITQYDVEKNAIEKSRKALNAYVQSALADKDNIMAEVFQEEEQPLVLWVLERWNSKDKYKAFSESARIKELLASTGTGLAGPVTTYYLKDVAPLSKDEWRRSPAKKDSPIVIMLFVDCKPGTEDNFKEVYYKAMPKFRSEPGVVTYGLSQSHDDATQFVTYEKFRNEDAFKYHLSFPPIQPVLDYLNTSIKKQPFQSGLHRLVPLPPS